jgi:ubiquinone/menaquinone biosynthesis C-methylase UbiE
MTGLGLDMARDYLYQAKTQEPGLFLIQADIQKRLPLQDHSLEGILCQCVLSLLAKPRKTLHEFHRILKLNGFLIIMDLHLKNPTPEIQNSGLECCFTRAVSPKAGQTRLAETGFRLLEYEDRTRLLAELGARLIFECGSMNAFWDLALGSQEPVFRAKLKKAKPGFHLMIAQAI